jgi:hypothetical protein
VDVMEGLDDSREKDLLGGCSFFPLEPSHETLFLSSIDSVHVDCSGRILWSMSPLFCKLLV